MSRGEGKSMIQLKKLNKEEILINEEQIESIVFIPETKIIMMNKEFFIVRESKEDVIEKILEFKRRIGPQIETR